MHVASNTLSFAKAGIDLCGPGLDQEQSCEVETLKTSVESMDFYGRLFPPLSVTSTASSSSSSSSPPSSSTSCSSCCKSEGARDGNVATALLLLVLNFENKAHPGVVELEHVSEVLRETVSRLAMQYREMTAAS
jgi:hypothetical protein